MSISSRIARSSTLVRLEPSRGRARAARPSSAATVAIRRTSGRRLTIRAGRGASASARRDTLRVKPGDGPASRPADSPGPAGPPRAGSRHRRGGRPAAGGWRACRPARSRRCRASQPTSRRPAAGSPARWPGGSARSGGGSSAGGGPSRVATRSGSPRSQPSLTTTTTALLRRTRRAQRRLNVRNDSPIRVPPDQSLTVSATRVRARSRSRSRSSRVTRVRRVPNTKASVRTADAARAWLKRRSRPGHGVPSSPRCRRSR